MEELTVVILSWLPTIHALASFANLKSGGVGPIRVAVSFAVYLFGSYLNSCPELERKWWKQIRKHKGRSHTEGLFAWSRNINYLGDTLLFAG